MCHLHLQDIRLRQTEARFGDESSFGYLCDFLFEHRDEGGIPPKRRASPNYTAVLCRVSDWPPFRLGSVSVSQEFSCGPFNYLAARENLVRG
jgi:hypothetical protein